MYLKTLEQFGQKPQSQPEREDQVKNNAGGFVFKLDKWDTLMRFLILGTEAGTYYVKPQELTEQNAKNVLECIKEDSLRAAQMAAEVSSQGRAHKNEPAIFVYALIASKGNQAAKDYVRVNLASVVRTGTHLFQFVSYCNALRGWGRSLKKTVASYYQKRDALENAYTMAKYPSRANWSHKDVLRLSRGLDLKDPEQRGLYDWLHGKELMGGNFKSWDFLLARDVVHHGDLPLKEKLELVKQYKLSREMLPTEMLSEPATWEALLPDMPIMAMVRNLGNMGKAGLFGLGKSEFAQHVINTVTDEKKIRKARLHPMHVLLGLHTYGSGMGFKGSGTWPVNQRIVEALDQAFYLAFPNVQPTGKTVLYGVDISGSMGWTMAGPITCMMGAAAMALVLANVETDYEIRGFTSGRAKDAFKQLPISPGMRLDQVVKIMDAQNMGATDCALPAIWAKENKMAVEGIVIITDNETWAGTKHPYRALEEYRRFSGIPTRQVVIGMMATEFSIADPSDPLSLDVVGFDGNAPSAVNEFIRG